VLPERPAAVPSGWACPLTDHSPGNWGGGGEGAGTQASKGGVVVSGKLLCGWTVVHKQLDEVQVNGEESGEGRVLKEGRNLKGTLPPVTGCFVC
jgi:hypothetical protein